MANAAIESHDLTPLRGDLPGAAGMLNPMIAGGVMAFSSASVALNVLRPCRSGRNLAHAA